VGCFWFFEFAQGVVVWQAFIHLVGDVKDVVGRTLKQFAHIKKGSQLHTLGFVVQQLVGSVPAHAQFYKPLKGGLSANQLKGFINIKFKHSAFLLQK
jgi:hypothetical protein